MSPPTAWTDLRPRLISGAAMTAVGIAAIAAGGMWFQMLAVFVTAVMIWELAMMVRPGAPTWAMLLAAATASVQSGMLAAGDPRFLWLFLLIPALGAAMVGRLRPVFFAYALAIVIAGWGLVAFRGEFGAVWLFWMIGVVIATDILGYFAGRMIGGPKFWPAVSPKKTWAGTVAGWIGAAAVGATFAAFTEKDWGIILLSMVLSFASQLGDIAESAIKRRMGVKDSSDLIPGHGGLLDRFDGLLGASVFLLGAALVLDLPRLGG